MGKRYGALLLILLLAGVWFGTAADLCGQQLDSASVQVRSLRLPQYKDLQDALRKGSLYIPRQRQ